MEQVEKEKKQVFLLTFQTEHRERCIHVNEDLVQEYVDFHRRHGHLVNIVPVEIVNKQKYV